MTTDEFVKNFYLERKALIESAFGGSKKSYTSVKVEELNLSEEEREKFRHIVSAVLTDTFYTLLTGLDGETGIGNSNQETFKIYDEQGNLISDCGELEAEAYEYFHNNKFEVGQSAADFIATITFTPTAEGGRQTPARTGYRPQVKFSFADTKTSGQLTFIERTLVFPGEAVDAEVTLLSPHLFNGQLKYNSKFELSEGDKVIGTGVIKHLLNQTLQSNQGKQ